MTINQKVNAIIKIAERMLDDYPQRQAALRHRFTQWGPTTAKLYLETMERLGYTLVRKPPAEHQLVSAARFLQGRAKELQRNANEIDTSQPGNLSAKAMTLVEVDTCNEAAEFLLEVAGYD